jgi:hypothetical protein
MGTKIALFDQMASVGAKVKISIFGFRSKSV